MQDGWKIQNDKNFPQGFFKESQAGNKICGANTGYIQDFRASRPGIGAAGCACMVIRMIDENILHISLSFSYTVYKWIYKDI